MTTLSYDGIHWEDGSAFHSLLELARTHFHYSNTVFETTEYMIAPLPSHLFLCIHQETKKYNYLSYNKELQKRNNIEQIRSSLCRDLTTIIEDCESLTSDETLSDVDEENGEEHAETIELQEHYEMKPLGQINESDKSECKE
jgi:hypothetical protein